MNKNEFNEAVENLRRLNWELENEYIENEGEITESTEAKEAEIALLRTLVCEDGLPYLGRLINSIESEIALIKASKDALTRSIKRKENYISYLKENCYSLMEEMGSEKIKCREGFSITPYISTTTTVNKDSLMSRYQSEIEKILRESGIPYYVGVTLTASAKVAETEGLREGDEDIFSTEEKGTVCLVKPRAKKEA